MLTAIRFCCVGWYWWTRVSEFCWLARH